MVTFLICIHDSLALFSFDKTKEVLNLSYTPEARNWTGTWKEEGLEINYLPYITLKVFISVFLLAM